MLECGDETRAVEICALHLEAYEDHLRPGTSTIESKIEHNKHHAVALHNHLYDRAIPIQDASMLTQALRIRIVAILAVLAAATSATSNFAMFWLLAWGIFGATAAALAITALPLGLGHLAYEKILSGHRGLQIAIIVLIAALGCDAVYQFGQARRDVMDKAAAQSVASSYVDDGAPDPPPQSGTQDGGEKKVQGSLGGALFMASLAAELALGFLVGLFVQMRTDANYGAWRKLKDILTRVVAMDEQVKERYARIEIAKKQCMAGIRRAQAIGGKRHTPYYKALVVVIVLGIVSGSRLHSQTIDRYDGILIDMSTSIARSDAKGELFQEYLRSTKKLLATEPPRSRVWVSTIGRDSFGGVRVIVTGWTPDARGIFTDDLDRARRQLTTQFTAKSVDLAPTAKGTDIFGGLWHLQALFDSLPSRGIAKTIWIFSDMMNETTDFPMPQLLEIGPERMLERAKEGGLLVPMPHYKIFIFGASPAGLSPRAWRTVKHFWTVYFRDAGAELVTYSTECDVWRTK